MELFHDNELFHELVFMISAALQIAFGWNGNLSVLDWEANHTVTLIKTNGNFCATALKTLKWNFRNSQLVTFLKVKSVLALTQISTDNHIVLGSFQLQLRSLIIWLESVDNISPTDTIENISKVVIGLPKNLRSQFYKDFKENIFSNYHIKLRDFERQLGKQIDELFNNRIS